MPVLSIEGLTKRFGSVVAVDGIDLVIEEGEFITLLGPSGCGKTTTIRMIGGYVSPTSGRIVLDGVDVTSTPSQTRNIGMVFQSYALFPHMSVGDNIAYPLKLRKWSRERIAERVGEMLDLVRLPQVAERYPSELSGGQQQRVALARALSYSPRMLLMDEALGALDAKLREYMQLEVRRIQQDLKITTVHVTHDQDEALGMSDRVVVMRESQIAQVAAPRELYDHPSSAYVADFVGRINFLPARVIGLEEGAAVLELDVAGLAPGSSTRVVAAQSPDVAIGARVQVGIRPEHMKLAPESAAQNSLAGSLRGTRFNGALEYLTLDIAPATSVVVVAGAEHSGTEPLHVRWPPDRVIVLPDE